MADGNLHEIDDKIASRDSEDDVVEVEVTCSEYDLGLLNNENQF